MEQGTLLDCVEYNVMETGKSMEGAVEELKVAQRWVDINFFCQCGPVSHCGKDNSLTTIFGYSYQRNTGKRRCILLLILIIAGLIIVLIYKPRSHPSPPPPPSIEDAAQLPPLSSSVIPTRPRPIGNGPIRPPKPRPRPSGKLQGGSAKQIGI